MHLWNGIWLLKLENIIDIKYPYSFIDFSTIGINGRHFIFIAVLALCYFLHVIGHFKALKHAELSIVVPFEYTRLIFAGIFGYFFFNEVPHTLSYLGYALIIGSGNILI